MKRARQGLSPLEQDVIKDAVVIRRQDIAAPPIFDAYSNFYLAMKDMLVSLSENGTEQLFNHGVLDRMIAKCDELATYFHEQSTASWNADRKFPT